MRASNFEYRHQTLLHLLVVGLAFLTYAFEPDDIVWALVKHHTTYRAFLERLVFGTGAVVIAASALLQSLASARDGAYRYVQYPLYLGRILFAMGLGLLAPMLGTVILLTGELLLTFRLLGRDYQHATSETFREHREQLPCFLPSLPRGSGSNWGRALRMEASKWGLAVTMIVFTVTLKDRIAEILAGASFIVWVVLNIPDFVRPSGGTGHA